MNQLMFLFKVLEIQYNTKPNSQAPLNKKNKETLDTTNEKEGRTSQERKLNISYTYTTQPYFN